MSQQDAYRIVNEVARYQYLGGTRFGFDAIRQDDDGWYVDVRNRAYVLPQPAFVRLASFDEWRSLVITDPAFNAARLAIALDTEELFNDPS